MLSYDRFDPSWNFKLNFQASGSFGYGRLNFFVSGAILKYIFSAKSLDQKGHVTQYSGYIGGSAIVTITVPNDAAYIYVYRTSYTGWVLAQLWMDGHCYCICHKISRMSPFACSSYMTNGLCHILVRNLSPFPPRVPNWTRAKKGGRWAEPACLAVAGVGCCSESGIIFLLCCQHQWRRCDRFGLDYYGPHKNGTFHA